MTVGTAPAGAPFKEKISVAPKKTVKSISPRAAPQDYHEGLGFVTTETSPGPLPLSGDNVSSLIVMTNPDFGAQVREPEVAETNVHSAAVEENKAASAHAPKPKAKTRMQSAESGTASAAPRVVKSKPNPKQPEEVLPWLKSR